VQDSEQKVGVEARKPRTMESLLLALSRIQMDIAACISSAKRLNDLRR
jgi:hypothetical protein